MDAGHQVVECTVEVLQELVDGKLRISIIGLPTTSPWNAQVAITEVETAPAGTPGEIEFDVVRFIPPRNDIERVSRRNLNLAVREIHRQRGQRPRRQAVVAAWNEYMHSCITAGNPGIFQRLESPLAMVDWVRVLTP